MKFSLFIFILSLTIQTQNADASSRIGGCKRKGSIKEFVDTCLYKVGTPFVFWLENSEWYKKKYDILNPRKEKIVKRLFSLSADNKIVLVSNLGYGTIVKDYVYDPKATSGDTSAKELGQLVDHEIRMPPFHGISKLNENVIEKGKISGYKYANYKCDGFEDMTGKLFISDTNTTYEGGLFYQTYTPEHKKPQEKYYEEAFIESWVADQEAKGEYPFGWTEEEINDRLSSDEESVKRLDYYKSIDKDIRERNNIYRIVYANHNDYFMLVVRKNTKSQWEIIAIDNFNGNCGG